MDPQGFLEGIWGYVTVESFFNHYRAYLFFNPNNQPSKSNLQMFLSNMLVEVSLTEALEKILDTCFSITA